MSNVRVYLPTVLILFGILCLIAAGIGADQSRHDVRFPQSSYNAGRVSSGKWIRHVFQIKNLTLHQITVEALPECGCTTLTNPGPVKAMRTATVGAYVDTSGMEKGYHSTEIDVGLSDSSRTWCKKLYISFESE